ncbi:hypothetical protein P3T83_21445 [Pseudocitrobacter sp. 2023EL-00150]|uniref:hypothetical protein n=1 Tax=Pseudocitrobacter sp. 2023EL-00150 TaxID=3032322 RepID=UPI0023E43E72|nr:hypothetical protein [Pseudocitrobacter sp. 2023EL-00150]MDF3830266.1 hypothetical protein [Pseudocitrobacter sp. 2023EL-00150]
MWILIFWMSSPYSVTLSDAAQPTLQVQTQEFNGEKACKDAFAAVKKLNSGELTLRGVCAPKD